MVTGLNWSFRWPATQRHDRTVMVFSLAWIEVGVRCLKKPDKGLMRRRACSFVLID